MLFENEIPDFVGSSAQDVRKWWDQVISLGLNIHPDDDPANIVDLKTGQPALEESACKKIEGIYQHMFDLLGDDVYDIGTTAYMNHLGYMEIRGRALDQEQTFWIRHAS